MKVKVLGVALLMCGAAGCSGTMQGVVRGTGAPVQFNYEQGLDSDTLTAQIGGEVFRGKAVMSGKQSHSGIANTRATAGGRAAHATTSIFTASGTGAAVAVLHGSKGSTLSCNLQYADTSGFTTSGGVGVCQHSDGRIIDVLW